MEVLPPNQISCLTVVRTAVAIAVCSYNDGANRIKDILEALEISAGNCSVEFLTDKDTSRVMFAQRQARMPSKEYRRAQRLRRFGREEELAALEGVPYMAGGYYTNWGQPL